MWCLMMGNSTSLIDTKIDSKIIDSADELADMMNQGGKLDTSVHTQKVIDIEDDQTSVQTEDSAGVDIMCFPLRAHSKSTVITTTTTTTTTIAATSTTTAATSTTTTTNSSHPRHHSPSSVRDVQLKQSQKYRPVLTDHQIQLVVNTWGILEQHLHHLGADVFDRLFKAYPLTKGKFSTFKSLDSGDDAYLKEIRAHGLRVIHLLEQIVEHVHDPEHVIRHLHQLGSKHITYDAKPDYIDLVGPQFLFAIEPILGEHWTPEVEQAWADLFRLIGHVMKEAMMM